MGLHPKLAEAAWPYGETDDLNMGQFDLIVLADDAQAAIDSVTDYLGRPKVAPPMNEVLDDLMERISASPKLADAIRSNHMAALRALDAAGYTITKG